LIVLFPSNVIFVHSSPVEELRTNCERAPAQARIIFYYGMRSIPRPWSLVREELDEHFGFPVVAMVEQANDYFRAKLYALLEAA
jgi:hypothetical protein